MLSSSCSQSGESQGCLAPPSPRPATCCRRAPWPLTSNGRRRLTPPPALKLFPRFVDGCCSPYGREARHVPALSRATQSARTPAWRMRREQP
ncbi:Vacuolar Protein Sorting-Associated Protein 18-like [Manis pentadactyla]|nr:Vacuolar Protein Sorting-Associated Protein 18-like [Manis pentadactyla]